MLSDEVIDKVIERLTNRIEKANTYILKEIAKNIKKVGTLSPSKSQQLMQIIRYGGDYDKITKKLAEITELNIKEIYKIFEEVAKNDYAFAEQFYKYKDIKYIPYEENIALQKQVQAIASITANNYYNLTRTLAFATKDEKNHLVYTELSKKYQDVLDDAVININQGKETFDSEMRRVMKQLGESGVRSVDYASGRSMRLDSAVRMQLKGALASFHNELQEQFGKEFGADGVEISVHEYPAPDHEKVQGKQFSKQEFEKFQNDTNAKSYDGIEFPSISKETGRDRRAIGQYNCYHYTFAIVLGVSKPIYSNEQLENIIKRNDEGFEFEGKHYSMYEGTQLQRKIETEIRKQKDVQIMARAEGDKELAEDSQLKINQLTQKYKELSEVSKLNVRLDRMRVSRYRKIKINKE